MLADSVSVHTVAWYGDFRPQVALLRATDSGGSFWTAAPHKWWLLLNSCTTQVVAPSDQLHPASGGSFWTAAPNKWWLLLISCTLQVVAPSEQLHHTSGGSFWTTAPQKWWLLLNNCTPQVVASSEQLHPTHFKGFSWTVISSSYDILSELYKKTINCRRLLAEFAGNRPINRPVRNDASYSPCSKKVLEMFVFGSQKSVTFNTHVVYCATRFYKRSELTGS